MQQTSFDKHRLKAIVDAGGLRSADDIIRVTLDHEGADTSRQTEQDIRERIFQMCREACDATDVAAFDGRAITVFLHPNGGDREARARELLARLKKRLAGEDGLEADAVRLQSAETAHLDALRRGLSDAAASAPPEAENAAFDAVPVVAGKKFRGQFLQTTRIADIHNNVGMSYFIEHDDIIELDIAALRHVAVFAMRQLKKNAIDVYAFPTHLSNMRTPELRDKYLFEARQIPKPICDAIAPALVRTPPDLPADQFADGVAHLLSVFGSVWLFAPADAAPDRFAWGPAGVGVLLDAAPGLDAPACEERLTAW
ncbi:MAG: hypothetical protein MI723_17050, partial [Caulobacterales bacterium]|nr:hypothetical protein [Caulobacterales bacterium]